MSEIDKNTDTTIKLNNANETIHNETNDTTCKTTEQIKKISSFREIKLTGSNILLLCDIDDTLLYWPLTIDHFIELGINFYKKINLTNSINKSSKNPFNSDKIFSITDQELCEIKELAVEEYYEYRLYTKPLHSDKIGFDLLMEKINKLIFITARSALHEDRTVKHFSDIELNYANYDTHYTFEHKMSKGSYIKKYIDYKHFDQIIFVDDHLETLEIVKQKHPKRECYQFVVNRISN